MKICIACGLEKPKTEFFKDCQKIDGLHPRCKPCRALYMAERRKNPEILLKLRSSALKCAKKTKNKDPVAYREKMNLYRRTKYQEDPEYRQKLIKTASDRKTKLRKLDPVQRAIDNARRRVGMLLGRKTNSYSKFIGCTRDEFKTFIENQFQPGMTWENYGKGPDKWQIDHKYPLSVAYKEGKECFVKACLYTNLQPLWMYDNIKKGNKVE